jgi:hypothetical protein
LAALPFDTKCAICRVMIPPEECNDAPMHLFEQCRWLTESSATIARTASSAPPTKVHLAPMWDEISKYPLWNVYTRASVNDSCGLSFVVCRECDTGAVARNKKRYFSQVWPNELLYRTEEGDDQESFTAPVSANMPWASPIRLQDKILKGTRIGRRPDGTVGNIQYQTMAFGGSAGGHSTQMVSLRPHPHQFWRYVIGDAAARGAQEGYMLYHRTDLAPYFHHVLGSYQRDAWVEHTRAPIVCFREVEWLAHTTLHVSDDNDEHVEDGANSGHGRSLRRRGVSAGGLGWIHPRMLPVSRSNALGAVLQGFLAIPAWKEYFNTRLAGGRSKFPLVAQWLGTFVREMLSGKKASKSCFADLQRATAELLRTSITDGGAVFLLVLEICSSTSPPMYGVCQSLIPICSQHGGPVHDVEQPYLRTTITVNVPYEPFGPQPLLDAASFWDAIPLQGICCAVPQLHTMHVSQIIDFDGFLPLCVSARHVPRETYLNLQFSVTRQGSMHWLHSLLIKEDQSWVAYASGRTLFGEYAWYRCTGHDVHQLTEPAIVVTISPRSCIYMMYSRERSLPPYRLADAMPGLPVPIVDSSDEEDAQLVVDVQHEGMHTTMADPPEPTPAILEPPDNEQGLEYDAPYEENIMEYVSNPHSRLSMHVLLMTLAELNATDRSGSKWVKSMIASITSCFPDTPCSSQYLEAYMFPSHFPKRDSSGHFFGCMPLRLYKDKQLGSHNFANFERYAHQVACDPCSTRAMDVSWLSYAYNVMIMRCLDKGPMSSLVKQGLERALWRGGKENEYDQRFGKKVYQNMLHGPSEAHTMVKELCTMFKKLGIPTYFKTATCDMKAFPGVREVFQRIIDLGLDVQYFLGLLQRVWHRATKLYILWLVNDPTHPMGKIIHYWVFSLLVQMSYHAFFEITLLKYASSRAQWIVRTHLFS